MTIDQTLGEAIRHHKAGRLQDAERLYRVVLQTLSNHPDANHNLGALAVQARQPSAGLPYFRAALDANPREGQYWLSYIDALIQANQLSDARQVLVQGRQMGLSGEQVEALANRLEPVSGSEPSADEIEALVGLFNAKRYADASTIAQAMTERFPLHGLGWKILGATLREMGRSADALEPMRKAAALSPNDFETHYNLANTLKDLDRLDEAEASCRLALQMSPDMAEAHNCLGGILRNRGGPRQMSEAEASCRRALELKPGYHGAHVNLGAILQDMKQLEGAEANYRRALEIAPGLAEVHAKLGATLKAQGKLDAAIASYRKSLSLKPDSALLHHDLGDVLKDEWRLEEAIASYRDAILIRPDFVEAHYNAGALLKYLGCFDEAIASYQSVLSLNPDYGAARWSIAMCTIPPVFAYGDDPILYRRKFDAALADLDEWFCGERLKEGEGAVGSNQPFFLAYQEENNRKLLSRYGLLCSRLMNDWLGRQELPPAGVKHTGIIKLGIVSAHFCNHSVWHAFLKGWLQHLDRSKFELHLFHLGTMRDDQTAIAVKQAATFSSGKENLRQWVEAIAAQNPDVLIYPEIGMDPMTIKLASLRLAPAQLCTWGHPETTGLPSIDYYISAEDFEPPNAEFHYSERLVKLPHLGCFYPLDSVEPSIPDLGALGIDGAVPLFVCPGVASKYAPEHDSVFVKIARKLGRCQFIFFAHPIKRLSEILQQRHREVFSQAGLMYEEFVVTIPWQEKSAFYGLMQRADAYLDTIGFSGFNSAIQAVECALPIVTREGRFMRGRFASGILRRMGMGELVANTETAYVALAVKLAKDPRYRQGVRERIQESKHVLFNDLAPIKALEKLLIDIASHSGARDGAADRGKPSKAR